MDKKRDKGTFFSQKRIFEFNGRKMDFTIPRVMGILNITPDSFYDGGHYWEEGKQGSPEAGRNGDMGAREHGTVNRELRTGNWKARAEQMVREGAYIIDIGAVSTRPGAAVISVEEEKSRLVPVLKELRSVFPDVLLSVDTYRAEIAGIAASEGADIINDISGGTFDPLMHSVISHLGIPYIIMHIQGTPSNMQVSPAYDDVVKEVCGFLLEQARKLESSGHQKIILDPGFGFGKTVRHNFQILENLHEFMETGYPILAGLSRKSMINRVLKIQPDDALNGTTVLNTIALLKGASILRVHDVKEAVETIKLTNYLKFAPE
jgi:dihydropteroate synthase